MKRQKGVNRDRDEKAGREKGAKRLARLKRQAGLKKGRCEKASSREKTSIKKI